MRPLQGLPEWHHMLSLSPAPLKVFCLNLEFRNELALDKQLNNFYSRWYENAKTENRFFCISKEQCYKMGLIWEQCRLGCQTTAGSWLCAWLKGWSLNLITVTIPLMLLVRLAAATSFWFLICRTENSLLSLIQNTIDPHGIKRVPWTIHYTGCNVISATGRSYINLKLFNVAFKRCLLIFSMTKGWKVIIWSI